MVLQRYVAPLRHLRQLARQQSVSPAPPEEARCLAAAPVRTCSCNLTHDSQHPLQTDSCAQREDISRWGLQISHFSPKAGASTGGPPTVAGMH